jgi:hypothetical protein
VAPAGSVLAVASARTLHAGAGEARAVRPAEARHGPGARGHEAIERDPAKNAMSCERAVVSALVCSIALLDGCARRGQGTGGDRTISAGAGRSGSPLAGAAGGAFF